MASRFLARTVFVLVLVASFATLAACGARTVDPFADGASTDTPQRDAGPARDGEPGDAVPPRDVSYDSPPPVDAQPFRTAIHEAFPTIPDQGGTRIASPQVVVVTYADDPNAADDEAYVAWMMHSEWLTTVGREWGVSGGAVVADLRLAQTAPTTITNRDLEQFLGRSIADHSLPQPATGLADAVYIVFFPESTTITLELDGQVSTSCLEFGGYHETFTAGSQTVAYAAIPTCASGSPGLTTLETVQVATSHELIEAATDAHPLAMPAFQMGPDTTSGWVVLGGEVADLCLDADWRDATHIATRVWSNSRAALGQDPCIPTDTTRPYYNVSTSPDEIRSVSPGETVTFPIVGWSTTPVPSWTVNAYAGLGTLTPSTTVSPARMNNGVTGTVTVNIPRDALSGSYAGIIVTSERSPTDRHYYPLVVFVP